MIDSLGALQTAYDAVVGDGRTLRTADRIPDDWQVDSLDTEELLIKVEQTLGIDVVDDPRVDHVPTIGALCSLLDELVDSGGDPVT